MFLNLKWLTFVHVRRKQPKFPRFSIGTLVSSQMDFYEETFRTVYLINIITWACPIIRCGTQISGDYCRDFDYCDSWKYYCDSCDTIEYIEFSATQASSGSMACISKHGEAYLTRIILAGDISFILIKQKTLELLVWFSF